ncbi:hypothetical protein [Streptomyces sp. V3I7]|uniref:hypothetical protein n=1 Tax=Streptomyces sp. V3I7 TaxID=3042278 RepID=UPI00278081ED|nr:hypothetical protein [Streptomyces sp. V3I7]MDQ0991804.1 hypothetical protein [Streptomyces sp. V3I7]
MNVRLLALAGVAVCALALPLAVASAGPVSDEGRPAVRRFAQDAAVSAPYGTSAGGADDVRHTDEKDSSTRPERDASDPLLLGVGLGTAVRCGPELSSPDGIEAQTCVVTQGPDTWARTYYRNATGRALDAVLSLMGPGGRTVQMRCAPGADDEPATCETPRERSRGGLDSYTAVAEFAERRDGGPLLLRSGSNA